MKRLTSSTLCDLLGADSPAAVIGVLVIFPIVFALMWAYMAGWIF